MRVVDTVIVGVVFSSGPSTFATSLYASAVYSIETMLSPFCYWFTVFTSLHIHHSQLENELNDDKLILIILIYKLSLGVLVEHEL